MTTIIIVAIAIFLVFVFSRFGRDLRKDRQDLKHMTLPEKFQVMADMLNEAAFGGRGDIKIRTWKMFTIYEQDTNQFIIFDYSTGHLTITWKFKWLQVESISSKQFNYVRNINEAEQRKLAKRFIDESSIQFERHKRTVGKDWEPKL